MARYVLASGDCAEHETIERLLEKVGRPPDGWVEAVLSFAREPSLEAWDDLMRFIPEDVFYHRIRNTLQMLIRLDVDPNILFQCATRFGTTPEAIELVDRGLVDRKTIVDRGREGPSEARGLLARPCGTFGVDLGRS